MNMVQNELSQKFYYDKHANTRHFREREACFLIKDETNPSKGRKYDAESIGPMEILAVDYNRNNAKIQKGNKTRVFH